MNQDPQLELESFSRLVLGSKHRLAVLGAVARSEPGVIYAKQIAIDSGVAPNVVGGELKRFVEAGLLDQINEFAGGGQHVLYERRDSSVWELVKLVEREATNRSARNS